ncbi:uncharacterized protein LOC107360548 isoform X2 [Tetranychus urticae]|uniref:Uncharacterized protein n=1 Tax=Tetranychus urticae TaxID=32264 RepID=T1K5H8_TETUR|nr:uncharacterized protein LOC107360548 isoform X2 [Tetranychus urticae]
MSTVNSLKRPLPEPSDSCKLLACKACEKDDVVLNLKTCGCLLCDSCDGDSRDKCISCRSNVDPKIKVSFTKNPRCKFSELNQCYSDAEYKCSCIPDCFVCSSCLTYIHRKRFRGSCVPEILRPEITFEHEPCKLCEEFIAEFETTSEPHTKICFNCKTNGTIQFEKIVYKDPDWNLFHKVCMKSSQNVSDKIKTIEDELESRILAREQEIKKYKDAIMKIQNCLTEYTEQSDRQIVALKQRLENFKKISNIFQPDGTTKTILDLLKNKQLTLHGEPGKEQIIGFYNYYRDKINSNHRVPLAEQIKTLAIQNVSVSFRLANGVGEIPDVNIVGQPTCFIAQQMADTNSTQEIPTPKECLLPKPK